MPKSNTIYLDNASATPLDPEVLSHMTKLYHADFSNSSAIHSGGVRTKKILEESRSDIAKILNVASKEIIFTSGATEANNLAIQGTVKMFHENKFFSSPRFSSRLRSARPFKKFIFVPHIVTTNIEHASVLEVCKHLEDTGQARVTYVQVEPNGVIDPKKIKKALRPQTLLVSVMYANNEIGTIQPLREIAKEIRHYNKINSLGHSSTGEAIKILFHSDATQAINYLPTNIPLLGVDLLSFNSAKIYGPKGVGVLYKKRSVKLSPIMQGGDQEFGFRPGTENLPQIAGLSQALKITEKLKISETKRLTKLRDYFFRELLAKNSQLKINGDFYMRLPNNVNITIPKIPSDLLVIELSARGILVSAKSACKAGDGKASHVIAALRGKTDEIDGSIRFSLGRNTTRAHIDYTIKSLMQILLKLEKWYNKRKLNHKDGNSR